MAASSGLPMSFARYQASIPLGSRERLSLGSLRKAHGYEVHTAQEWADLAAKLGQKPVNYENLRRVVRR
jgi:hypothetical protein